MIDNLFLGKSENRTLGQRSSTCDKVTSSDQVCEYLSFLNRSSHDLFFFDLFFLYFSSDLFILKITVLILFSGEVSATLVKEKGQDQKAEAKKLTATTAKLPL